MAEEFEFMDLHEAVFWGVDLRDATFRDVDLTGVRVSHARLVDVAIDAEIDRLTVNGVDVTSYVNERDPWYRLRSRVRPSDPDGMRDAWQTFNAAWEEMIERGQGLTEAQRRASVDGEWSLLQTVRHLVFCIDKWFIAPILGGPFDRIGLPNSGSVDFGWPGLDLGADPSFDDAVAVWRNRAAQLRGYLDKLAADDLDREVEVLENGPNPVRECLATVFEEHFQHLRYATRDLDR